jgi:EAL domain-containing protein (putative c-di-GMP-specific phosphodiesterase class I)
MADKLETAKKIPGGDYDKAFQRRRLAILSALFFGAFVAALGIPLCIHYALVWALYALSGLLFVLTLSCLVFSFLAMRLYDRKLKASSEIIARQLADFAEGNIKILSTKHELPSLRALQDGINLAVENYSRYQLVAVGTAYDEEVKAKILEGYVFPFDEFERRLSQELQRNNSYRSALLFIACEGSDPLPPAALEALKEKIRASFPRVMLGRYDASTFAVYDFAVESILALKTRCEGLVASFNDLHITLEEDRTFLNYCRLGGVIYPYTPAANLISEGLKALKESPDVKLAVSLPSVYYPHAILSESNKRIVYLASMENFEQLFRQAKTHQGQIDALKDFLRWIASAGDFETGGVLLYSPLTLEYRVLLEVGKTDADQSFARLGERIPADAIDPFYEEASRDLSFSAASSAALPSAMSSFLTNLGIRSFYFSALTFAGQKKGFFYLTSTKEKPFGSLSTKEDYNSFAAMVSALLVSLDCKVEVEGTERVLDALSERSGKFLYTIDRATHKLTYLSENLRRCFSEAKVGDVCYKVLRTDHTSPCTHCPLTSGADHRVISNISAVECGISVLEFRGADNDLSTIVIEQSNSGSLALGSSLMDEMLLIKNAQALSLEVGRELKADQLGYVVSIELLGGDASLSKLPGADANSVMAAIVKNFQDAGYGDIVYRFGPYQLSFLLKSYTKAKIMGFVEEAAEILSTPLEVKDVSFKPAFAYSAIAYPGDVTTVRQLTTLIPSELKRSANYGEGMLVEVADKNPRKALRADYILTILTDTLNKDSMPILIQPIVDAKSKKVVGGDLRAALFGRDGLPIPPAEFIPIAQRSALVGKVDLGSLQNMGHLYETYAFTCFRSVGLNNLSMYLSVASLQDPTFPESVKKIFSRYKFPRNYVSFEIGCSYLLEHEADLKRTMESLAGLGIIFEAVEFDPDQVSLDALRKFGIPRIKTDRTLIWDAVANPGDSASFSRFVDSALRDGFYLTCAGIETSEQGDLAFHLDVQRSQGYLYGRPMSETDFIKHLNYGN